MGYPDTGWQMTSAPVLAPEKEIPHCGYFTGKTTPPACQVMMRRYRAAIRVATAAQQLAAFVERSLNVGPITTHPSREAFHWRKLRFELDEFNKLASVPGKEG